MAFADLPSEEKGIYLNEGIALFPEVFNGDYRKFTPWLVYSCFVWCGNVRDIFSSGGNRYVSSLQIYVSAIMYRALKNIGSIKQRIADMTKEEQDQFWGKSSENMDERLELWIGLVKENLKLSSDLIRNNKKLQLFEDYDDDQVCMSVKSSFIRKLGDELRK